MSLFLTPNGRIEQGTYWRAVLILFAISAVFTVISAYVSPFLGFLGIITVWPWIAVHVKRFHDADKTGWITIAMVVLAIVVSMILGMILPGLFGIDQVAMQAEMMEQMEDIAQDDPGAMIAATMEMTKKAAQAQLIPSILATALTTGVVGVVMSLFKSDPNTNQYGPPVGMTDAPESFS